MDKQKFLEQITAIGTCEDEADRRTMLTALSADVEGVFEENATLTQQNQEYVTANEKLRQANMELFLQIGKGKDADVGQEQEEPKEKLSFENLFDERGNLK